jgi:hypothetical protein
MEPLSRVYYFPIDGEGNEIGEPIPIELDARGVADLSKLPPEVQRVLRTGFPKRLGLGMVKPWDGSLFLERLLEATNGYMRFRSSNSTSSTV